MPAHLQNTVTPLRGGPLWGGPAGFEYVIIPCAAIANIAGGATEIDLQLPILIQWWGRLLDQMMFSFISPVDAVGVVTLYVAGQGPYTLELAGAVASGSAVNAGDFIQVAWDADAGVLQGINWTTVGTGGGQTGNEVIVTTAGPFVVAADTSALIINKAAPSVTGITLGPVAARGGLPLVISDFGGNAGDMTITPDGTEKIMGLSSLIIGSGGAATLYPNIALQGWAKGN